MYLSEPPRAPSRSSTPRVLSSFSFSFNYFLSRQNPAGIELIEFGMFQDTLSGRPRSQGLLRAWLTSRPPPCPTEFLHHQMWGESAKGSGPRPDPAMPAPGAWVRLVVTLDAPGLTPAPVSRCPGCSLGTQDTGRNVLSVHPSRQDWFPGLGSLGTCAQLDDGSGGAGAEGPPAPAPGVAGAGVPRGGGQEPQVFWARAGQQTTRSQGEGQRLPSGLRLPPQCGPHPREGQVWPLPQATSPRPPPPHPGGGVLARTGSGLRLGALARQQFLARI